MLWIGGPGGRRHEERPKERPKKLLARTEEF
jgi:hypothetical protein